VTSPRFEIKGGADPEVAAAIGAVIAHLVDRETTIRSEPVRRPRQSAWALVSRPRDIPDPLPSHTYSAPGWSTSAEAVVED
jgi:hypothetical protein